MMIPKQNDSIKCHNMQGSLPPVDARSFVSPQNLLKDQKNNEKQARSQTKNRKKRIVAVA